MDPDRDPGLENSVRFTEFSNKEEINNFSSFFSQFFFEKIDKAFRDKEICDTLFFQKLRLRFGTQKVFFL